MLSARLWLLPLLLWSSLTWKSTQTSSATPQKTDYLSCRLQLLAKNKLISKTDMTTRKVEGKVNAGRVSGICDVTAVQISQLCVLVPFCINWNNLTTKTITFNCFFQEVFSPRHILPCKAFHYVQAWGNLCNFLFLLLMSFKSKLWQLCLTSHV